MNLHPYCIDTNPPPPPFSLSPPPFSLALSFCRAVPLSLYGLDDESTGDGADEANPRRVALDAYLRTGSGPAPRIGDYTCNVFQRSATSDGKDGGDKNEGRDKNEGGGKRAAAKVREKTSKKKAKGREQKESGGAPGVRKPRVSK
jgi:hypothetical protein